jgi:hypothetical protein
MSGVKGAPSKRYSSPSFTKFKPTGQGHVAHWYEKFIVNARFVSFRFVSFRFVSFR